jgi:hypothetical protein
VKILLRIQDLYFLDGSPTWWRDPSYLRTVLQAVEKVGLWREFGYYGQEGHTRHKIDSLEGLIRDSTTFEKKTYSIVTQDVKTPSAQLDLDVKAGALTIRMGFQRSFLKDHRENLLSQLIDVVCRIRDALGQRATMGPLVNVEIIGSVYPRVRPPRFHRHFVFGTVATIICKNFHAQHPLGSPEEVKKMLAASVPDDVQRVELGDLVIFRWAEDIRDEPYVTQCRSRQEQWLVRVLDPPLDSSYNAAGDHVVFPVGTVGPDAYLTWYDAARKYGYKAVVVFPDGSVDEDLFAEMTNWIQRHRLPDGREIQVLCLITQSRAAALIIHDRAAKLEIKAVYYSDDKGQLWDPFPPGPWIESQPVAKNHL